MLPAETGTTASSEPPPAAAPVETISPRRAPDLLSSVCHDLKDPLASIVMGAGFLRRALPPEDQAALRVVEAIHRAADRMSQLISSFSDLARLETHELTLDVRPHDIEGLVRAAFETFASEAAAQNVAVSMELAPELPTVPCDRERMLQVLRHLSASALRVVPERGSIVVGGSTDPSGALQLRVIAKRGTGPGSRRIGSEPPKPALALARGLVELHGGSLTVVGDGDSLTLAVLLPRVRA
ncbi:MAG TPA: HAMP domain-containing sensor histidine kinase [Polyangiaceae bacterium]|jgi:signal transduction histidine kinase|nr:HAMP domain-containing sensor histidine kinase [Polyangiaceae bacterium]